MSKLRWWTLASIFVIVPAGFGAKYYRGPGADWVANNFAGSFYCAFWCLVVLFLVPRWSPRWIALGVLIATCILEFSQISKAPVLEAIRSNFIGRSIIGSTFDWFDFPYYFLGSGVGWLWTARLKGAFGPMVFLPQRRRGAEKT
jgi:hypothetical protein